MQTSDRIRVHPVELSASASHWQQQEWDLRSVRDAIAGCSTAGFASLEIASLELAGFLAAWAAEIGDLAVAVGSVARGLDAAGSDFGAVDRAVAGR